MAEIAHPKIVAQSEWLAARRMLLTHEKELTKHYDRVPPPADGEGREDLYVRHAGGKEEPGTNALIDQLAAVLATKH